MTANVLPLSFVHEHELLTERRLAALRPRPASDYALA
jgi:hypothetical protein